MIVFIYTPLCQAIKDLGPIEEVANMNLILQRLRAHKLFSYIAQRELFQSLRWDPGKSRNAADQT
jgi:hypothetical protein